MVAAATLAASKLMAVCIFIPCLAAFSGAPFLPTSLQACSRRDGAQTKARNCLFHLLQMEDAQDTRKRSQREESFLRRHRAKPSHACGFSFAKTLFGLFCHGRARACARTEPSLVLAHFDPSAYHGLLVVEHGP
jgi:hypothetical protein